MTPTTYATAAKAVHLIHKCKKCKQAVRTTVTLASKSVCNNHPVDYLHKTQHYRQVTCDRTDYFQNGRWVESQHSFFPPVPCPGCGALLAGKAIEGRYNPKHPCDPRCTGATGHNCECACGGENHGADHAA